MHPHVLAATLLVCSFFVKQRHCLCFRFLLVWRSTRTQFLLASAITIDENRNFQHLLHIDRRQLQLSRRRCLHGCTASFVRCRSRNIFSASFCGAVPRNKDDMGDGVPTEQLSRNDCDCTDSHCNSHIVASCVFALLVPTTSQDDDGGYLPQCLQGGRHQGRRPA